MLSDAQVAQLKTELQADPAVLGYAPFRAAFDENSLVTMLNFPRDGVVGPGIGNVGVAITIRRNDMTPADILAQIDTRDLKASPTALEASFFERIMDSKAGAGLLRLFNDDDTRTLTANNILRLVGNTNGSQGRLDAVSKRNGSRSEQLFGQGTRVDNTDVAKALR